MNTLLITGKYLDQPRLVGKLSKHIPTALVAGGAAFSFHHIRKSHKENRRKEFIKSASVLTATIGSALLATRGIGKIQIGKKTIFKGIEGLSEKIDLNRLAKESTELIDEFLKKNKVSEKTGLILERAKNKVLSFSQVKTIFNELHGQKNGQQFLNKLIPDPENIDSKHIFSEIQRLSVIGLVPVLGGIFGGILGDKITEKDWKERIPNKIKEGSYQYLANIFLCNIGAGAALGLLEKLKITSKSARAVGMVTGIAITGVIGGSAMANFIGRKCIDPIFGKKHKHKKGYCEENECNLGQKLYSERTPEALDVGLHIDDIATVAVLSGLKWIEPALPILYSISGYRAGIGYRNGKET